MSVLKRGSCLQVTAVITLTDLDVVNVEIASSSGQNQNYTSNYRVSSARGVVLNRFVLSEIFYAYTQGWGEEEVLGDSNNKRMLNLYS